MRRSAFGYSSAASEVIQRLHCPSLTDRSDPKDRVQNMETHVADITRVIQLAVAPVFLLTAVATLINALNIRLGRIVDRRRVVDGLIRSAGAGGESEYGLERLALLRRTQLIYFAIFAAVLGALLVCLVVAGAFVGALLTVDLARLVAIMFVLAMLALVVCLALFLREVFLAVTGGTHHIR